MHHIANLVAHVVDIVEAYQSTQEAQGADIETMTCTHVTIGDEADFCRTSTHIDIEEVLLLILCRLRHHQQALDVIFIDDLSLFVARDNLDVDTSLFLDVFQNLRAIGCIAQSRSGTCTVSNNIINNEQLAESLDHAHELFLALFADFAILKYINTEAQWETHELQFLEKQGAIVLSGDTLDEQSGSIRPDINSCYITADIFILSYHLNIVYIVLPVIGTSYGRPSCHTLQSSSPRL